MKQAVILEDQLSGAQVPPDVRVSHPAGRHGEQTQSENEYEHPTSVQESGHGCDRSQRAPKGRPICSAATSLPSGASARLARAGMLSRNAGGTSTPFRSL